MNNSGCDEMKDMDSGPRTSVESLNFELWTIYNIQRDSYLNKLYYGSRAATWSAWNLWLQVGAAIGSLGAVTGFLTLGGSYEWGKWAAAFVGMASSVCAALPAIMGHAEKVNRFEKLHFAYCELFELAKRTAIEIRRTVAITDVQLGSITLLSDMASRLGKLDDPDRKDAVREECEKAVRERFPEGSLWYAGEDAGEESSQAAEPAEP